LRSAPIFGYRKSLLLLRTLVCEALEILGVLLHVAFREGIFLGRPRIFLRDQNFELPCHGDFGVSESILNPRQLRRIHHDALQRATLRATDSGNRLVQGRSCGIVTSQLIQGILQSLANVAKFTGNLTGILRIIAGVLITIVWSAVVPTRLPIATVGSAALIFTALSGLSCLLARLLALLLTLAWLLSCLLTLTLALSLALTLALTLLLAWLLTLTGPLSWLLTLRLTLTLSLSLSLSLTLALPLTLTLPRLLPRLLTLRLTLSLALSLALTRLLTGLLSLTLAGALARLLTLTLSLSGLLALLLTLALALTGLLALSGLLTLSGLLALLTLLALRLLQSTLECVHLALCFGR